MLEWAWSGGKPLGELRYESGELAAEIFGLVICQYDESEAIYLFSCDANCKAE
ncbi:hypothetical protein [Sessilibacter corallicola]|uniref:Uncharacterized protein n=1 Tax=Sessilibacter corallicola TaxID=2904075 RepID=A0ABQ0ACY9_9GAMM